MRKLTLLITGNFLWMATMNGQPSPQFTEGLIIKKNGDTLKCFVELTTGYDVEVKYKDEEKSFVREIASRQIKKVITDFQYFENIQYGKKERIMILAVRGPVKLYKYIKTTHGASEAVPGIRIMYHKSDLEYVIKKGEAFYEVTEKNLNNSVVQLLGDCGKVIKKINGNAYKFEEFEQVIKDYNDCNKTDLELANEKKLIGKWMSDLADETTKNYLGEVIMTYTEEGRILYDIIEGKDLQRLVLTYRTAGDTIFSFQSSQPDEQVTRYKFEGNDKLILEINGMKSIFLRMPKMTN